MLQQIGKVATGYYLKANRSVITSMAIGVVLEWLSLCPYLYEVQDEWSRPGVMTTGAGSFSEQSNATVTKNSHKPSE